LASRVKHHLGIKNSECFAFDILFGCPGYVQGVILTKQYILVSGVKNYLVIGFETLSRVVDPFDMDSMIFADGAAAAVISEIETTDKKEFWPRHAEVLLNMKPIFFIMMNRIIKI
jgi:3-oxoacyl-[acyl-carrier-protein] synthase-3